MVGETPYAEGFGDVGGPLWQDNGVPRPPRTCGWPRTLEQEPINLGDRHYHPLYPFGWGLRAG